MKKFYGLSLIVLLIGACAGISDRGSSNFNVKPTAIKTDGRTVVNNPGKGWQLFVSTERLIRSGELYKEVLELGTVGYTRFNWKDIQQSNEWNVFDWTAIEQIKNAWKAEGKQFSFRIMAANTHGGRGEWGKYMTPRWVFENNPWGNAEYTIVNFGDDGFNGEPGEKVIPIWNDPGFIKAVEHLAKAIAEKYGNDPDIAYFDIGTYGNWGEQHLWPLGGRELSRAELQEHIKLYYDAFRAVNATVRLVIPFGHDRYQPVYDYAIDNWKMAIRRDGVLGGHSLGEELIPTYGKVPGISETYASWDQFVEWNSIPGHPNNGLWTDERLWKSLYTTRPTYQSMMWDLAINRMYDDNQRLMKRAANLFGFHFILSGAVVPREMKPGTDYWIEMSWQNHGLAPIYEPANVAFALLDRRNNVVTLMEAGNSDVSAWMPGVTIHENAKIRIPATVANGDYRLAVGIFGNEVSGNPKYNIAIKGRIADNFRWYPLCKVTVSDAAEEMSEPFQREPVVFDSVLAEKPVWINKPANLPDYLVYDMKKSSAARGTPPSLNAAVMDPVWNRAPILDLTMERLKWFPISVIPDVFATAVGRVLWDENNLYVRIEVKDSTPYVHSGPITSFNWTSDGVEIYLDEDNSRSSNIVAPYRGQNTYRDTNAFKLGANGSGMLRKEATPLGYDKTIVVSGAFVPGGYIVEMKLPFVNPVRAGQVIGFDFQVNDQIGIYSGEDAWRSVLCVGWNDFANYGRPDVFGELTLLP